MEQRIPMTQEGYAELKAELHKLKTEERPKNVREIELALEHGDLSENAEYHAAKEKQAHIAGRIAHIDDRLARAHIIEPEDGVPDRVRFGVTVVLAEVESGEETRYRIVGEDEADPKKGKLSVTSPVAQALMNKQVNDEVLVRAPKGNREFEILEILY